jgi:hypothetical protein
MIQQQTNFVQLLIPRRFMFALKRKRALDRQAMIAGHNAAIPGLRSGPLFAYPMARARSTELALLALLIPHGSRPNN